MMHSSTEAATLCDEANKMLLVDEIKVKSICHR